MPKHRITFASQNRPPRCQPNPDFPDGIDLDPGERPACKVDLPYPAKCIGTWIIECNECNSMIGVTAAGRPDDPKSVMFPCKPKVH